MQFPPLVANVRVCLACYDLMACEVQGHHRQQCQEFADSLLCLYVLPYVGFRITARLQGNPPIYSDRRGAFVPSPMGVEVDF